MKNAVLSLLLAVFFLVLPASARANSFCGGLQDDITSSMAQLKCTITTPSSYRTYYSGDMTCAWIMISGSSSDASLVQVGYATEPRVSSVSPHYFWGHITTSGTYTETRATSGPSTGSSDNYLISTVSGGWKAYIDGDEYFYYIGSISTPQGVQTCQETTCGKYYGASSSKVAFSGIYYMSSGGSTWVKPSLSWVQNSPGSIDTSLYGSSNIFSTWQ